MKLSIPETLMRLADRKRMSIRYVARCPHLLKEAKLNPDKITEAHITEAGRLEHDWEEDLNRRTWALGGTINGLRDPETEVRRRRQVQPQRTSAPSSAVGTSKRPKLFDHSVTAVLRYLGKENWTPDEVEGALQVLGVKVARGTIVAQLQAGRKGERGPAAPLDEDEVNSLWAAEEKFRKFGSNEPSSFR